MVLIIIYDNNKIYDLLVQKRLHLTNIKFGSANNIILLGRIFDKNLTFKNHVVVITRKISISVCILFKLCKYLPLAIIKTLYYTLINHFLLYGIEVWYDT